MSTVKATRRMITSESMSSSSRSRNASSRSKRSGFSMACRRLRRRFRTALSPAMAKASRVPEIHHVAE
jgi:hypothetical protein